MCYQSYSGLALLLTIAIPARILDTLWLLGAIVAAVGMAVGIVWAARRRAGHASQGLTLPKEPTSKPPPTVAVVVPVLNEAHVLEKSIATLRTYLHNDFPYPAYVIIADNGSTDGTGNIARRLHKAYPDISMIQLSVRGRGRALRTAWRKSKADIVAYTDVDLSTGLSNLAQLCRAIHEEGYDIATGSRLLPQSQITRCLKREVLSRVYNWFVKYTLWTHFNDAQCGFKAVSRRVVDEVIPLIRNQNWFFDTELLVLGEKLGFRIKEVPVRWIEDTDSRVKILATVWEDIKGVLRLRWLLWSGRLRRRKRAPAAVQLPPTISAPPAENRPSAQPAG